MKRVLILPCGIIALLTILIVTCPGDADFGRWLADEHGIQCHFHEHEHKCVHPVDGKEMLVYPKSRHVVRSGIYSFYDSVYEDVAGEQFEIKAFGRAESLFYEVIE